MLEEQTGSPAWATGPRRGGLRTYWAPGLHVPPTPAPCRAYGARSAVHVPLPEQLAGYPVVHPPCIPTLYTHPVVPTCPYPLHRTPRGR